MKENKKIKDNALTGFMNNISVFIITLVLVGVQFVVYKVSYDTSFSCGTGAMQFGYSEGFIHIILVIVLALLFVATIVCSIFNIVYNRKNKKMVERIMNVIFAIINIIFIIILPLHIFILDLRYGNDVPEYDTSKFTCQNGILKPIEE